MAMKPSYAADLAAHALNGAPDITAVETLAQVGAVGHHWPAHGLRITFTDGAVVYLASVCAGSLTETLQAQPDHYTPGK